MLPSYTTYLIDLDGVVYRGEELISGAKEFVSWLNATHKKYLFLTNNSFASDTQVISKLARLGIATDASHVLGAGQAAVKNIARRFPNATVYVVGEQHLLEMVKSYDLHVFDQEQPAKIPANPDAPASHLAKVVLVGLDRAFDYKKITGAATAIRGGAAFVAINRDSLLPIEGDVIPGCGAMVAAIEAASSTKPEVVGKPEPTLLQEAMHTLGSQPNETLMIGDSLDTDIAGGLAAKTHTLLVLSGKDSRKEVETSPFKPEYIYENLAAVVKDLQ
ncbi:MAG: TIGR01457 family HAD-type hydrolase [Ktedonobacteraceae bacterium]